MLSDKEEREPIVIFGDVLNIIPPNYVSLNFHGIGPEKEMSTLFPCRRGTELQATDWHAVQRTTCAFLAARLDRDKACANIYWTIACFIVINSFSGPKLSSYDYVFCPRTHQTGNKAGSDGDLSEDNSASCRL